MNPRKKAVFNWSGGKDSALALQQILEKETYDVVALLTTVQAESQSSSIHAIPLHLLERQAECLGLPLYPVFLSADGKTYDTMMAEAIAHFKDLGVRHFIFGDIFLEDVKQYRVRMLEPMGIQLVQPLWGKTSEEVYGEFIQSGIKSKVMVTQADRLDQSFIGRDLDAAFAQSLPEDVDLCGENGEYHSFAYDGPMFRSPVHFNLTQVHKISHEFTLDSGEKKQFYYWQAKLE